MSNDRKKSGLPSAMQHHTVMLSWQTLLACNLQLQFHPLCKCLYAVVRCSHCTPSARCGCVIPDACWCDGPGQVGHSVAPTPEVVTNRQPAHLRRSAQAESGLRESLDVLQSRAGILKVRPSFELLLLPRFYRETDAIRSTRSERETWCYEQEVRRYCRCVSVLARLFEAWQFRSAERANCSLSMGCDSALPFCVSRAIASSNRF